jgi:hypothetical protein
MHHSKVLPQNGNGDFKRVCNDRQRRWATGRFKMRSFGFGAGSLINMYSAASPPPPPEPPKPKPKLKPKPKPKSSTTTHYTPSTTTHYPSTTAHCHPLITTHYPGTTYCQALAYKKSEHGPIKADPLGAGSRLIACPGRCIPAETQQSQCSFASSGTSNPP